MSKDELIGFVASGSSATYCRVILIEGKEDLVREEDFAFVLDRGTRVLGILRLGRGTDENLRPEGYSPGIDYVRKGLVPASSRRSFSFGFSVIGRMEGTEIKPNRLVITPGSPVYLCRKNPFENLSKKYLYGRARHWEHDWSIPLDPSGIPMHIGVFASTGGGKSYLTWEVLIPLMLHAGYSVLVFDWHGLDYVPKVEPARVLNIFDIRLDEEVVARYINEKARYFGFKTVDNKVFLNLREVIEADDSWRNLKPEEFPKWLLERLAEVYGKNWEKYEPIISRGLNKLSLEDWQKLLGKITPAKLIEKVMDEKLIILDMSGFGDEEKLSVFLSIGKEIKQQMLNGKTVNLALVIDEAPQYVPYHRTPIGGIQSQVKKLISDLAATGRKFKLALILIAQGMAGDIGIDPAIRRNLNTHFIGRLLPQDKKEVETLLEAHHISFENILRLEPGQFYLEGKINPFPTPILISFDIGGK